MLSFNDTKIAFADKTPQDLKRSYWLFKIVANNSIVTIGSSITNIALQLHLPIKGLIKATIFKQFCGGESIDECESKINALGKSNIGIILDYSVEGKESEKDFDACATETIATIKKSTTNKNIPFSVFKVTGVARFQLLEKIAAKSNLSNAEEQEYAKIKQRIHLICQAAHDANTPVFIDAEETWIQNTIDDLAANMMATFNIQKHIVYNTLQMYRKDRLEYLKRSFELAKKGNYFPGFKIVRGAYLEKERNRAKEKGYPSPIQDTKQNTDADFDSAISFCIDNIDHIAFCAATHNEISAMKLTELMNKKNISKNNKHIYFAQLLGMSDHISYNLANAGYNVAKYVPYGPVKEVLPYLIRRAQENTFVKGQTGRELGLIVKEKQRREVST
jgi:proline dehydrogenase